MKRIISIFIAASQFLSLTSFGDGVTSHLEANAKVKFFSCEEHPSIFLKCWGGPTKTDSAASTTGGSIGSDCTNSDASKCGPQGGTLGGAASHGGFDPYTPQSITYSSQLTEDKVFKLSFSQKISAPTESTWESGSSCTIHKKYAQVEGVSNRFRSAARLTVPENVFVLRVRKTSVAVPAVGLTDKIVNTAEVALQGKDPNINLDTLKKEVVGIGGWEYRFVRPGDQVDFIAEYTTTDPRDVKFTLDYEITFIGQNRCESVLQGITKFSATAADVNQVFALVKSGDEAGMHNFALAMGCLGNSVYRDRLFTQSSGKSIAPFLKELQKRSAALGAQASSHGLATRVIAEMGLFNLARGFLTDLKPYCDIKQVRSFAGPAKDVPIQVRGFSYAALEYALTWKLYNQFPIIGASELAKNMDDMRAKQLSFETVMGDENNRKIVKAYQTAIFSENARVFEMIQRVVSSLPETKVGQAARSQLLIDLKSADAQSWALQAEIADTLKKFGRSSKEIIDPTSLKKKIEEVSKIRVIIAGELDSMIQWFDEDMSTGKRSAFYDDLFSVNYEIMNVIGGALNDKFAPTLAKFVDYDGMRKLYTEIGDCLATTTPN